MYGLLQGFRGNALIDRKNTTTIEFHCSHHCAVTLSKQRLGPPEKSISQMQTWGTENQTIF